MDINYIKQNNLILLSVISGSHAYGTNTSQSDVDIRGVFIQPLDSILRDGYIEQITDETNDTIYYELKRFVELLIKNNPNILEMLAMPEDCVQIMHPLFKEYFVDKLHLYITKLTKNTFFSYAKEQIKKAKGYNKKMNWEESKITRKTVLDFCYVINDNGSISIHKWLKINNLNQINIGLSAINHARDTYMMYNLGNINRGIVSDENLANDVQLSNIPKELKSIGIMIFNKDAYSIHCKNYREYQKWLKDRNVNRVAMNKSHGKNYDSKNMMHLFRILHMAEELTSGVLRVRRTPQEIEALMKIRRGERDFDELVLECEKLNNSIEILYDNCSLPENVNENYILDDMLKLRKNLYSLLEHQK